MSPRPTCVISESEQRGYPCFSSLHPFSLPHFLFFVLVFIFIFPYFKLFLSIYVLWYRGESLCMSRLSILNHTLCPFHCLRSHIFLCCVQSQFNPFPHFIVVGYVQIKQNSVVVIKEKILTQYSGADRLWESLKCLFKQET